MLMVKNLIWGETLNSAWRERADRLGDDRCDLPVYIDGEPVVEALYEEEDRQLVLYTTGIDSELETWHLDAVQEEHCFEKGNLTATLFRCRDIDDAVVLYDPIDGMLELSDADSYYDWDLDGLVISVA